MERRRVRALSARTEFVPGFGQVHFDPDSKHEDVRQPLMPVTVIDRLARNGWIADDIEGARAAASGDLSQLDHDGDGDPGGSRPHEPPALTGMLKTQLLEQAAAEGVEVTDAMTKAEIITAIEGARAALSIDAGEGEGYAPA